MKRFLPVVVLMVLTIWFVGVAVSYQVYDYVRQISKLNVVDSLTVGESVGTDLLPAITSISVPSSNPDTLLIVIRNPTTATNDTAEIALH